LIERFCPNRIAKSLEYIDQQTLQQHGIAGLIIDVDNTLVQWRAEKITPARLEWLQQAKEQFAICLLSNAITARRIKRLGQRLGVAAVGCWALGRKPFAGGFKAALRHTGTSPAQTAMIGDQLWADILGGNRMGMYTVLVERLSKREFFLTALYRLAEAWCLAWLHRKGMLPAMAANGDHHSEP